LIHDTIFLLDENGFRVHHNVQGSRTKLQLPFCISGFCHSYIDACSCTSKLGSFRFLGQAEIQSQVMNSSAFWDIMLCSLMKVNQHFGGICCPPPQSSWLKSKPKQETSVMQVIVLGLLCYSEDGNNMFLHVDISQKIGTVRNHYCENIRSTVTS
jgi:hypothetical protein